MLERLKILTELNGVSGNETTVRKYIRNQIENFADEVYTDHLGNLYAHKRGSGKRIMLCAHMDEVGLMISNVMDNGMLSYQQIGLDPRMVVSKRVYVGLEKIPGIIGSKANHLQSPSERNSVLAHKQLFVDIGSTSKAHTEKFVKVGDYIGFATEFEEIGDSCIKGKALDDRIGCAILIDLLKNDYDCDLFVVFTTMEEIGLRGAQTAAFNVKPDIAIMIDVLESKDKHENTNRRNVIQLGSGPIICLQDRSMIMLPEMVDCIRKTIGETGINCQYCIGNDGNSAGAIGSALDGCMTSMVAVPCRYTRTPCGVANKKDIENVYKLVDIFLKTKKFNEVN